MRTASLFLVLVLAKAASLQGHDVAISWWSPIAYFWHDALVALIFAAGESALRGRRTVIWAIYGVLVAYAAVNIPVVRVLSTPLTWFMWRAAGGALSDSIWYYASWQNLLWIALVLLAGAVLPLALPRVRQAPVVVALLLLVLLGPSAARRVDTRGLDRNAWTALTTTAIRRVTAAPGADRWETAGFDRTRHDDLSRLRGIAGGRNIVLVGLESTAAQYLGLYGAAPDVMPNLSELARSGITFQHAYAAYPESIKGLFSILCSTYPAFGSDAERYGSIPCEPLAAVLSGRGYRTSLFHSGRFMYLGMDAVVRGRGFDTLADAGDIGGNHESSFGVDEPATVSRMLEWVDAAPRTRPFFLMYLPIAGHHPYETPEPGPFPERDEFGRYRNALHYADQSLGALRRGLQARGLDEHTLWVVYGDHGEAFGQHDGNFGHTFFLYEENVHVPLVIAAPGLLAEAARSLQVVSLVDVAPTILELAGVAAPQHYQGRSMFDGEPRMARFLADYSLGLLGLRDGPVKFIYEIDSGRTRLFDLDADPHETIDRGEQFAERKDWYQRDLQAWIASQAGLLAEARSAALR